MLIDAADRAEDVGYREAEPCWEEGVPRVGLVGPVYRLLYMMGQASV